MTGIYSTQPSTRTAQQHTATKMAVVASWSPLTNQVTPVSSVSASLRSVNGASPSKSKIKLGESTHTDTGGSLLPQRTVGKWCFSFQVEDKAGRTALTLIQEDLSFHNVRSVNGASPSKWKIKLGEQYSH